MNATLHQVYEPAGAHKAAPQGIHIQAGSGAIRLRGDQHIHAHHGRGWVVRALAGTLWITQDGDLRDVVLEAGQSFALDRDGPALLAPIGETEISIERRPPRPKTRLKTRVKTHLAPAFSAARALFA
jgi:hypothetical protein